MVCEYDWSFPSCKTSPHALALHVCMWNVRHEVSVTMIWNRNTRSRAIRRVSRWVNKRVTPGETTNGSLVNRQLHVPKISKLGSTSGYKKTINTKKESPSVGWDAEKRSPIIDGQSWLPNPLKDKSPMVSSGPLIPPPHVRWLSCYRLMRTKAWAAVMASIQFSYAYIIHCNVALLSY